MNAASSPSSGALPTSSSISQLSKPGKGSMARSAKTSQGEDSDDYDEEDDDEDEFFDCRENLDDTSSLAKWSSMELTPIDGDEAAMDQVRFVQGSISIHIAPNGKMSMRMLIL